MILPPPTSDTAALSPDNLQGKPVVLKYVKFQNVHSLTIFIEENQCGSDITKVQKTALYGATDQDFHLNSGYAKWVKNESKGKRVQSLLRAYFAAIVHSSEEKESQNLQPTANSM
ncbi:hypothetical protein Ancab_000913 [Ancistrocladus abbreviatus]